MDCVNDPFDDTEPVKQREAPGECSKSEKHTLSTALDLSELNAKPVPLHPKFAEDRCRPGSEDYRFTRQDYRVHMFLGQCQDLIFRIALEQDLLSPPHRARPSGISKQVSSSFFNFSSGSVFVAARRI